MFLLPLYVLLLHLSIPFLCDCCIFLFTHLKMCDTILLERLVINMKNRLIEIRKAVGYSQQKFADKLNIKRGTIANYECGRNEPIDAVISLICREFNVNETWLRTGEGEMFLPEDRDDMLSRLTVDLLSEEEDSFKNRFVSLLARMTDEEWTMLENMVEKLSKKE